jgi:hypothetical protein
MATNASYIETRITEILVELTTTNWGPDVSDQGRSIQPVAYKESLLKELKELTELRSAMEGPFTVIG